MVKQQHQAAQPARLTQLMPAVQRWAARIDQACDEGASGWHRMNVRIEKGRITSVQLILDEQIDPTTRTTTPESA